MSVLVDSSIWVDYFRGAGQSNILDLLIEENLVVINELILTELIPPLNLFNEKHLVSLLRTIKCQPMSVDWEEIIHIRTLCLRRGINGVGIPDLLIAQNSIQGGLRLLSNDKHFALISKYIPLELFH